MLIRTHFVITVFAVLLLVSEVEHKFVFAAVALFATLIPDVDSKFSKLGKHKVFRGLQFFVKHRGIFHSFVFLILLTLILFSVFPVVASGFFIGYGLHLFADSFTKQGVCLFYPFSKKKSRGFIRTGGMFEIFIFVLFLFADVCWILLKIF